MADERETPPPDENQPRSAALAPHLPPDVGDAPPPRLVLEQAWQALFTRKRPNIAPPRIEDPQVQDRRSEGMAVRLRRARYNGEPIELPGDPSAAGRAMASMRVALGLGVDPIVDLAVAAGGLSFATAAIVHSFGHSLTGPDAYTEVLARGELLGSEEAKQALEMARRLREHLVGAPEEERQAALGALVEALDGSDTSCSQRLLASYLFPSADELRQPALDAAAELPAGAWALMFDLRDEAELDIVGPHLDLAVAPECLVGAARVAAAAEVVVARVAEVYAKLDKGDQRIVVSILAALPQAAPLRFLAERLPDDVAQMALADASEAYPVRCLEHLGSRALEEGQRGEALMPIVSLVLRRFPAALEAATQLDDDVRAKLTTLAEELYVPPPAPLEDCPPLLRQPPWTTPEEHPPALVPKRLPKLPPWVSTVAPPVLESGGSLPPSALEALLMMLALSKNEPYGGLAAAREGLTERSLARFAKTLFEAWYQAGMPSKESWAFKQLAFFGDEACVVWLSPLLERWASDGGAARVPTGFEILAAIGSDLALLHLHGSRNRLSKKLSALAAEKVEEIAKRRGLKGVALADRRVPDVGLDSDGTTTLDFGARRFVVSFDQALEPILHDEGGRLLEGLPKPTAKDDAAEAKRESARYRALVKNVGAVAAEQVSRLKTAMNRGRSWSPKEFEELLVGPPLRFCLTRRLLWGAYDDDGALRETFRIDEARAYRTVDGTPATLDGRRIGIVKKSALDTATLAQWVEVFEGRALVQPFEQLAKKLLGPPSYAALQAAALKKLDTLMARGLDELTTEQAFEHWLRFAEHPFFALKHRASRRRLFPRLNPDPSWSPTKEVNLCGPEAARRARKMRTHECTGTEVFFQIATIGHSDEHCFVTKDLSRGVAIAHHEDLIFAEDEDALLNGKLGLVSLRAFFAMLQSQDAKERARGKKEKPARKKGRKRAKPVDPWTRELEALRAKHGEGSELLEAVVASCLAQPEFLPAGRAWVEKHGLVVNRDDAGVVVLQRLLGHEHAEARSLGAKALRRALRAKRRAQLERLLPVVRQALASEDLAVAAQGTYVALPRAVASPELVTCLLHLVERFRADPTALDRVPGGGINLALQNIARALMGFYEWRQDSDPQMAEVAAALLPIQNMHVQHIIKGPICAYVEHGREGPVRDRITALHRAHGEA